MDIHSKGPSKKPKKRVTLRLPLHKGQHEVRKHKARFKIVACGRQWGKTRLGCPYAFKRAFEGGSVWWVAPTYELAKEGWRVIRRLAAQAGGHCEIHEGDMRLEFNRTGGFLQVKSAHVEGRLRGATLDLVVMDEAAFMPQERWTKELRATLAVKQGEALFLSTFNGENWFYDLYERGMGQGQAGAHPGWMSWRHKSVENPYIDGEEVEEARRTLPDAEFQQEYEANPLVYVGAVFHGEDVQRASERGAGIVWRPDLPTSAGLDWGYSNPTAFEVCQEDPEGRISWIEERMWHSTELNVRCAQIVAVCEELKVKEIYADAAGADENATLAVALSRAGMGTRVIPVPFNKYKEPGIKVRRFYLERGQEAISPKCSQLLKDSKRYRYREGREGTDKVLRDEVLKKDDHTVDACTAFYASRRGVLVGLSKARSA